MSSLNNSAQLVCYWWRTNQWAKSVSWWKDDQPRYCGPLDEYTVWRSKFNWTKDKHEACTKVRNEWVKAFAHSKYLWLQGKNHRLEPPHMTIVKRDYAGLVQAVTDELALQSKENNGLFDCSNTEVALINGCFDMNALCDVLWQWHKGKLNATESPQ